MSGVEPVETALRELAPAVLGVLVRRHRDFDACEDALQDALLAASRSWPVDGRPANPTGWLVTTATRRLVETWRRDAARRRRESDDAARAVPPGDPAPGRDDTLALLVLCCHPALTPPAQVALTLRAVGGLTTAEIARGLLVPEATVAQRISRAKARIAAAGARFAEPSPAEREARLPAVLEILYRIYTEGHTASAGEDLQRPDLGAEAIRLARQLHGGWPGHGEVTGLLALVLLTDARRPARVRADGALVPLAEQDRRRWDRAAIAEGVALLEGVLPVAEPGPFQVQAAIAAVHDEAPTAEETDWHQILGLYGVLEVLAPSPVVTLNRIVALAMVEGPRAGLERLDDLAPRLEGHHRVDAVRAHLLERVGERAAAVAAYRRAAQRTLSGPEQRYLARRAAALA
ncbi:sigma factor-like helix-turn-helix DNA-binding protein [Actinomycetospora chlora]|uniref:Sigma factor-like helix-turn-helix DNA-binding protein n=1 Tax=Actinomycetospora chlora TaxID=663608 RepID=A0ABP9BAY7_9PSEU